MLSILKSEESKIKKEDEERAAKRIKTEEDKSKIDSTKLDDINILQNVFSFLGISSSDKKEKDGRKSKKKRKSKTKSRKKRKSKSKY